jgi:hypothetical protein
MISLSDKEKGMILIALDMRRNYIETGDVTISAADITKFKRKDVKINALSTEQMQLIIDTEYLIKKLYQY